MIIGKVIGTVISTRKNSNLTGSKFLIVAPLFGTRSEEKIVAVDNVGAGVQDVVLVATGSAARVGCGNENSPVDACIVGIIDDPNSIVITE